MRAFTLFGEGRLAKDPELTINGEHLRCRFTLIGNEFSGKDEETGEITEKTVALHFVAFGGQGEAIAQHARKGDQLIVQGHINNNNWEKNGEVNYGYSFVLDSFRFGAPGRETRERLTREAEEQEAVAG